MQCVEAILALPELSSLRSTDRVFEEQFKIGNFNSTKFFWIPYMFYIKNSPTFLPK